MTQIIISMDPSDRDMIYAASQSICRHCKVVSKAVCRKAKKNLGVKTENKFTWVMQCSKFSIKR